MTSGSRIVRWLLVLGGGVGATLVLAALMILPALIGLLPHWITGRPVECTAVALVAAFAAVRAFAASRPADEPAAGRARRFLDRLDARSTRAIDGGLAVALGSLAVAMLAAWAPHYVTWPWCRDEDTFATLAQSWDAGIRPYRDIRAYNFPGHIYLHWLIGRILGWGRTVVFYALDVVALGAVGA